MALTRLDNLYSSKTGKYLYVSPDDFNATDELDNRGNSPLRPFKTIQRAFIEVARYSYLPGKNNDRFDQFSIMLMPGNHYIDNRPGLVTATNPEQRYVDAANLIEANKQEIIDRSAAQIAIQYPDFYYPGDTQTGAWSRFKDAYRLIQLNRSGIITTAFNAIAAAHPGFTNPDPAKCQRDIGYFIDAVSLDICQGGGNRYTLKFIKNYFNNSGTSWINNGLQGEEAQSNTAFNKARDEMQKAVANQLAVKDLTITPDPATGDSQNPASCANVQTAIATLTAIVTAKVTAGPSGSLPAETVSTNIPAGEVKCKRDIGYVIDAVVADLRTGGNSNTISATKAYFDRNGNPISNGLVGEVAQSVVAFTTARDMMQKAVTNQLYSKDFTILEGPAIAGATTPDVLHLPSGNPAQCVDVQNTIATLIAILNDTLTAGNLNNLPAILTTGVLPVFNYNRALQEWQDNSILDLSNPDNVLYKFNAATGGCIVPRGCSLIGYDLRRTIVRPLYVPDPADGTQERTSIFNLTGGCYLWQFTIKDGDLSSNSPLYDENDNVGKVYFQKGNTVNLAIPEYSHHKITIMAYADGEDLDIYYEKVGRAFAQFQPEIDDGEFEALVQENRIVGPLSDTRRIESIKVTDSAPAGTLTVEVTTKIDHGYFVDQYVAILNSGLDEQINGTFKVSALNATNPKVFQYQIQTTAAALGLVSGTTYTTSSGLGTNAVAQAEIDSVESASPYVFNCSIRSTWGLCGMWADGSKATGFKSMVVAQYTGVSLQKDDRAFIRYDRFTNTWNQASLTDAFATIPYHTKGDAYWKDDWRNFHIRASDDSFIQCVSVFAVGFFDHFLMESGGDMSITNSNSNFGNTSLHAIGYKGFSFNQDKGGYITDIIPPKVINASASNEEKIQYYTLDIQASNPQSNHTKLYLGSDDAVDPANRPAASIQGYRLGAKTNEKLYVKLDNGTYYSTLEPTGFERYTASIETLNPAGITIDNLAQDAANRIEDNKTFIQNEAYKYIVAKYPDLLTNTNITISKCERDIGYFVDAVVSDLRLGGNINTIQAAEGYFVGGSLAYIENELEESIEAYEYVKQLCIAAMRNFDYLLTNCSTTSGSSIVNVGDTTGLLIGMTVREYNPSSFTNGKLNTGATAITSNIPANTYIKRILDGSRIELGTSGSKLNSGTTVNALQTSSTAYLYFTLPAGAWSTIVPTTDPTLVQDTNYPECANVASTISGYFDDIFVILNQGVTPQGGRWIDAHNLILGNKELIAEVAVARMLSNFPGFTVPGGNQNYINKIITAIEAISFNVKYGSNNKVYELSEVYITGQDFEGEEDQAVYAFLQARDMAIQAMRNETITITGSSRTQYKDLTVAPDPANPDCADVATAITTLTSIITQAIGTSTVPGTLSGVTKTTPTITSVTRIEPVIDYAGLAKRATLFTVDIGGGSSNPHNFETGTPVRLVPRAKAGTNPDKRVIRLPKGFDTNTKYYVIAPGRTTVPEDYSSTTYFNGSDQTKLMLAATKENAAAGIYIYSPETDAVDPDVEIEIQQYVLDEVYDLHKYKCNLAGAGEIQTDVAHIFDLPNAAVTPQKVFFRVASDIVGSDLPEIAGQGTINSKTYYFARFVTTKKFSIHTTHADAIAGVNAISFVPNSGQNFYVFADKRVSPLRYDAAFTSSSNTQGLWYLQVTDESSPGNIRNDSILYRFHDVNAYGPGSGKIRTLDTWYTRTTDSRGKEDRVYRLKYVIPSYLTTVRDPLNGFVLKIRTDDKRRLVPQRILLKPIGGAPSVARFDNPLQVGEKLGYTFAEYTALGITPNYDPYFNPKVVSSDRTQSRIAFSIQSARKVTQSGTDYLELIAFDHTITVDSLKNEIFTVVEITSPQGGSFVTSNTTASSANAVFWNGNSSGNGYIQGYFTVGSKHYLVLKNTTGAVEYSTFVNTRFTQGSVFADLKAKPNSIGDAQGRDKSSRKDFLYRVEGANVYTVVPGDIITDDASNQYRVESVDDVGQLDDTFYIFDIDTIQERIPGQQDGIYYLTCVRGNISPFPTGAGVGENFRNFRFSQPISQLYPVDFKNDPLWFKQLNPVYNDVPATVSAADNYVHGLVTVNDAKASETKELVFDLVEQPALNRYNFVNPDDLTSPTLTPVGGSNIIEAQEGNATSGSEDRYIPICGDSQYPTERKLYVELRRPSIARSGNHTFEYLGFGPGNYSTGFPLRQEVVLSDTQDFYAQSKREDGGIVFYTGLNSNGDLYIGNRKVNAITGEETFLEQAVLSSSEDDSTDNLGALVTTFDTPVTFNDRITVEGNANFNNPVEIAVPANEGAPLRIFSIVDSALGDDSTLSRSQHSNNNVGDITLGKNRINAAIFGITPRQTLGLDGQFYSIRTHYQSTLGPTNVTPDQTKKFNNSQEVFYGSSQTPVPGDILLKGSEVGLSGSLGWIFANYYTEISDSNIQSISSDGSLITISWASGVSNADVNVAAGSLIRITNFSANTNLNGIWTVLSSGFSSSGGSCKVQVPVPPANGTIYTWSTLPLNTKMEVSRANWKEVGLIGGESLRTLTETWGDYKLGINTLARATNDAYLKGFVQTETQPRANLDVVGNSFISGKSVAITVSAGIQTKVESFLDNALVVGGNSASPNDAATLRVATTNSGRVGINVANSALDRALVIGGTARITGDFKFENDIDIDGGGTTNTADVRTAITTGTFNLLSNTGFVGTLNLGSYAATVNAFDRASALNIADTITGATNIDVATASNNLTFTLGNPATTSANVSRINIGGAYNASSTNSVLTVKTNLTSIWGDVTFGANRAFSETLNINTSAGTVNFLSNSGATSNLNFATNASVINIGAQGGSTTVRNSLTVDASFLAKSTITLDGGTASFSFNGDRAQLGSTISSHTGTALGVPADRNVDFVVIVSGFNNTIDTAGAGTWGGTFFQNAIPAYTADSGGALVALTGNRYYLPLTTAPTYAEGDDLIIDTTLASGQHPEIVKVATGGLVRVASAPYYVIVERQPYGTFLPLKTNHPDGSSVKKVNVSLNSTWLTANVDNTGSSDVFALAEFGGVLNAGDYLFVSRNDTGTTGEVVKIGSSVGAVAQSLIVTNGAGSNKFVVNSTTGATTISDSTSLGGLTVFGPITFKGGCGSVATKTFALTDDAATPVTRFSVDMCTGNTIIGGSSSGGSLTIGDDFTIKNGITGSTFFSVDAQTGNTVIGNGTSGTLKVEGTTGSTSISTGTLVVDGGAGIAENLFVGGDLNIAGGDLIVTSSGTTRFKVNNTGTVDLGGISEYFTSTGGRKWLYVSAAAEQTLTANINYFVNPASNLVLKLPTNPQSGDMIRVVDIGGNITYNLKVIVRCPTGVRLQGDDTNTAATLPGVTLTGYQGGELIVTTPNAAFGLVYAGNTNPDGSASGVPSNRQGWWLMEI